MKRKFPTFIVIVLIGLLIGCDSGMQRPWNTLRECEQANTDLSFQIEQLQMQNDQLVDQLKTSLELNKGVRLEAINTLEKIRIGKRTGFYDKDNNGTNETLVVYLEPLDTAQDTIKAVGKVNIELWSLNQPEDGLVTTWTVEPDQLHKLWGGNIFASYYRIKLPLEIALDDIKEYTVKVTFTDYLSGKVLNDQKVIQQ